MKEKNHSTGNGSFENKKRKLTGLVKYSGLAFQMIAIILLVLYGGMKLDEALEKDFPLFTVIGAFTGVVLSLYFALKDFLKKK